VLANLFLHDAFDAWMARRFPAIGFEGYADDAVVHCVSQRQARMLVRAIADRMAEVGLGLHPAKTRIVYCKDGKRQLDDEHTAFTFLGFTFRARGARGARGERFTSFLPAISKDALGKLGAEVRRWRLHRWTGLSLTDVAQRINLIVRGWMQYYGAFYRTALYRLLQRINTYLVRWLRKKHRRLRPMKKAKVVWRRITSQDPRLFAHWAWAPSSWWSR
jgi:RNA-directed DNA polymerase